MEKKNNRFLWFFVSFIPCFGAYLALHFTKGNDEYNIGDMLFAMASIPVLVIAWAISRNSNRPLAQGFIWSLAANFIFVFTFGGCGLLRIGR